MDDVENQQQTQNPLNILLFKKSALVIYFILTPLRSYICHRQTLILVKYREHAKSHGVELREVRERRVFKDTMADQCRVPTLTSSPGEFTYGLRVGSL